MESGESAVGMFGKEGNVLQARLADFIKNGIDIGIIGASIGSDVYGFLGTVVHGLTEQIRKVGSRDLVIAKEDHAVARDSDHEGIVALGGWPRRRVICWRHIDGDLLWIINLEARSHQEGKQGEHDAGESGNLERIAWMAAAFGRAGAPLGCCESHCAALEASLYWTPGARRMFENAESIAKE